MAQHTLTDTITFRRGLTIPNCIALAPMQSQSALEGGYARMIRSVITIIVLRPQAY